MKFGITIAGALLVAGTLFGQSNPTDAILPPQREWHGASEKLIAAAGDTWRTPAEASDFRLTPTYDETTAWLQKLVASTPHLRRVSIGRSAEGREIWMIIASKHGATPEALRRSGLPTVVAQGGIHAGEIDGKDAGLMLLRDTRKGARLDTLLDRVNLLFVPILNVDGHERASKYTRINQQGPENGGWRTTPLNLNINRDYAKLDAPETRAIARVFNEWSPDLYIDLHVTDGSDYQYDITWGYNDTSAHSPAISKFLDDAVSPPLRSALSANGHVPGSLIFEVDNSDIRKGLAGWNQEPRYSAGYADIRHVGGILVENHSLKPYKRRVLGTYVLLESVLRSVGERGNALKQAVASDMASRRKSIPLGWDPDDKPSEMIDFLGIESKRTLSPISGGVRVEYNGNPVTIKVPLYRGTKVTATATRPRAYWIHPSWSDVIERLHLHGIQMTTIDAPRTVDVTMTRFGAPKYSGEPFEGHITVTAPAERSTAKVTMPRNSVRVSTDQPLGDLAVILLESDSPDSFFQWGFFHSVLARTEYVEAYIMEPTAETMLEADPKLREEFMQKVANDAEFRNDSRARLQWLYSKTPYYDQQWRVYPVYREE